MRSSSAAANGGHHTSLLQYRDGFAIALLAVRPLRLANFLGVTLGVHLVMRHGTPWLCFESTETKNRMDLEFPFPTSLSEHLAHYLEVVRPVLAARRHVRAQRTADYLWLSQSGNPMGRQTLYAMLKKRTKRQFGKAVNPHLFRDCLATSIASGDANLAWTIPHMLGHWTPASSETHYVHTSGAPEHTIFQRHLEQLKARSRPKSKEK
jgi:site-specific recombinase XerD